MMKRRLVVLNIFCLSAHIDDGDTEDILNDRSIGIYLMFIKKIAF